MRDPETFETRLAAAYRRFADEVRTDVDPIGARADHRRATDEDAARRAAAADPCDWRSCSACWPSSRSQRPWSWAASRRRSRRRRWSRTAGSRSPRARSTAGSTAAMGSSGTSTSRGEGTTARRIIGSDGDGLSQGCPRFSPDGSMLAYGEGDESVRPVTTARGRWPVTDRAVVVVGLGADGEPSPPRDDGSPCRPVAGPLPCPEWSPGGAQLAFFTGPEVWVADAVSGVTMTFPVTAPQSEDFEWSPDGSAVAVNEPGRIRIIPIDGTAPTVFPVIGEVHSMDWTQDGRRSCTSTSRRRSGASPSTVAMIAPPVRWLVGWREKPGGLPGRLHACLSPRLLRANLRGNPFVVVMGVERIE